MTINQLVFYKDSNSIHTTNTTDSAWTDGLEYKNYGQNTLDAKNTKLVDQGCFALQLFAPWY